MAFRMHRLSGILQVRLSGILQMAFSGVLQVTSCVCFRLCRAPSDKPSVPSVKRMLSAIIPQSLACVAKILALPLKFHALPKTVFLQWR